MLLRKIMAAAVRVLADILEASSASSRGIAKAALKTAAETATEEDAVALKTLSEAVSNSARAVEISDATKAMLEEETTLASSTTLVKSLNKDALEGLDLVAKAPGRLTAQELRSLSHVTSKAGHLPDGTITAIERFVSSEENKLISSCVSNEGKTILAKTGTALTTEADVKVALEGLFAKETKFQNVCSDIVATLKIAGGVTAVAYCAQWIYSYITENSGPFITKKVPVEKHEESETIIGKLNLTRKHIERKRIGAPYPCGFRSKTGIKHPLDTVIRSYVKSPCDDWKRYDKCGGWGSLTRLQMLAPAAQMVSAISLLNGGKLTCEDVSLSRAFVALIHAAGTTVGASLRAAAEGVADGLGFSAIAFQVLLVTSIASTAGIIAYKNVSNEAYKLVVALAAAIIVGCITFIILSHINQFL